MKNIIIVVLTLFGLNGFAQTKEKKEELRITRTIIQNAKSWNDLLGDLKDCKVLKHEIAEKLNNKPAVFSGEGEIGDFKFLLNSDRNSRIYIDMKVECAGKLYSKTYGFKISD